MDQYALPAVVTFASMAQQARFTKRVGMARGKFKVQVPDTTGDPGFERVFRAHQNCVELYPLYLSSLWMSSLFFHPVPAAVAGAVYIIARQRYFNGYEKAADLRMGGFMLGVRALMALLATSGVGVATAVLRHYADIDLAAMASDLFGKVMNK